MVRQRGYTLLELIVVLGILSILATISILHYARWMESAQYRAAAREIASAMRESRSRAIQTNLQHRFELDLAARQWRIVRGDRATQSSSSSWENNVVKDWQSLQGHLLLKGNKSCTVTDETIRIVFNPSGTSNARYICVNDAAGELRFQVAVPYSTTGRVVVK
jgi:prepilin-type N-terminal cleavage/methylation domain-containing protein